MLAQSQHTKSASYHQKLEHHKEDPNIEPAKEPTEKYLQVGGSPVKEPASLE